MVPVPADGIYEGDAGLAEAERVPNVEDIEITAKPGQRLLRLPEGSSYLGFIFARAESPDAVEQSLRTAHAKLSFRVAPALPVISVH
jgi:hypothetical protein